jgi:hypothetical protein
MLEQLFLTMCADFFHSSIISEPAIQVDPANARLAAHSVFGLTLKRQC